MIFLRRCVSLLLGEKPMYLQAWSFFRMQIPRRFYVGSWLYYGRSVSSRYTKRTRRVSVR